jgi:hypothetical protein
VCHRLGHDGQRVDPTEVSRRSKIRSNQDYLFPAPRRRCVIQIRHEVPSACAPESAAP